MRALPACAGISQASERPSSSSCRLGFLLSLLIEDQVYSRGQSSTLTNSSKRSCIDDDETAAAASVAETVFLSCHRRGGSA